MFDRKMVPGQIRWVDFGEGSDGIQGGLRPAIVSQNEKGCLFSPVVRVIPLTTRTDKAKHLPMHVLVPKTVYNGLLRDSIALVEQETSVHKNNVGDCIGHIEDSIKYRCGLALIMNSIDIFPPAVRETVEQYA